MCGGTGETIPYLGIVLKVNTRTSYVHIIPYSRTPCCDGVKIIKCTRTRKHITLVLDHIL